MLKPGAGNETRTRDPDLGKVVLYQLSYSRVGPRILRTERRVSTVNRVIARSRRDFIARSSHAGWGSAWRFLDIVGLVG